MKRALALIVMPVVALAACGGGDEEPAATSTAPSPEPSRTVEVSMTDMAYAPSTLEVAAGETVRFVFRNDGAVRHEAVFGSLAEQEAHHAEMAEMGGDHDGMDMGSMPHDSADMGSMPHGGMSDLHAVMVEPGQTVEITHTFGDAGSLLVGCHEPGHWEAGMRMDITIV